MMYSTESLINSPVSSQLRYSSIAESSIAPASSYYLQDKVSLANLETEIPHSVSLYRISKRVVDILVSAGMLFALSPLMIFVAALITVDSAGPALFYQTRLTTRGRRFQMLKFRTMRLGAEDQTGPCWTTKGDPRITTIGKFLRLTHIDELPQLINVIKGEMSLIGPRPERPELVDQLKSELPNFSQRLLVPGGITGLAQVSSGYAHDVESYRSKLEHDLNYVQHCSWKMDLSIALKTVLVLLTGSGAR